MDPINWQQRYQNHDTPWDKGRCHPMTAKAREYFLPGDIFVPGCGRGWDASELRDLCPTANVIGLDLSANAIADARKIHGLDRLLWYEDDLFRNDDDARFARVRNIWEHTCHCALPPSMRSDYVKRIATILPCGGMLCGVFFTHMDDQENGPPWNTSPEEIRSLYEPWFDIVSMERVTESFAGREGEESFIVMRRR